jgi:hypothetical protein
MESDGKDIEDGNGGPENVEGVRTQLS